jgi:Tfp pilus assembly protein PilZ/CheY-like chemotaxis protein
LAMKYPHLIIAHKEQSLPRLERVLQRWGCRTTVASGESLRRLLAEDRPDLLLVDSGIRKGERQQLATLAAQRDCPLLEMQGDLQLHGDGLPADILLLLERLQEHLLSYPRRELRIRLRLPVLIEKQGHNGNSIGQILNLSVGGIFLKNGSNQAKIDETVLITIPLLGMKKELEISGRVLYLIEATQENGFRQGLGISFEECTATSQQMLRDYIRMVLEQDTPDPIDASVTDDDGEERTTDNGHMRRTRGPSLSLYDRRIGPSC